MAGSRGSMCTTTDNGRLGSNASNGSEGAAIPRARKRRVSDARFNAVMPDPGFERTVLRLTHRANIGFGEDVVRLRIDAGITRLKLARTAGVNDSYLARIEAGVAQPSVGVCIRLGLALGADMAHRLYPTTGPTIRDRLQAAIAQTLLSILHPRWHPFLELAVRRPSRGWIDVGLHASAQNMFVTTEIQSELRRLEQLIRWSEAKADSVPSWDGFARLGGSPVVSRLLIVRETRTNRAVAEEFRRVVRAAYPARPDEALESLVSGSAWPGPAVPWAARDRARSGAFRIVARQ